MYKKFLHFEIWIEYIIQIVEMKQLRDQIEFSAQDVLLWIIVFNYKLKAQGSSNLMIASQGQTISTKTLNGTLPIDLQVLHPYYNDVLLF